MTSWLYHSDKSFVRVGLTPGREKLAARWATPMIIPRKNPPERINRARATLWEKTLPQAALLRKPHEFPPPPANAEASPKASDEPAVSLTATRGSGKRTLYFHGHYDVVPAQSPQQFQPARKEHFVFGRGSCYMKGGIVAILFAIQALKECGVKLHGQIALTLVPDEETGGARTSAVRPRDVE